MKKTTKFQKLVRENRKLLKQHFKASTVSMWEHGNRTPEYEAALMVAYILNMSVEDIPYYRVIINR
jgi:DNA-binding XRE family transcriptional regulator